MKAPKEHRDQVNKPPVESKTAERLPTKHLSEGLAPPNRVLEREAEQASSHIESVSQRDPTGSTRRRHDEAGPRVEADGGAPAPAKDGLRSSGQPLDSHTRATMESGLGHDFGKVRIHTDSQAAESAHSLRAKAYTSGDHVVFGSGRYDTNTSDGRKLLAHELTHVAQQDRGDAVPAIQRAPLTEADAETEEVASVSAADKTDAELVHGIIDTQLAILTGWETALANFDKVLTSASAKSAKPDFRKVFVSFFQDQLMGELISRSKVKGAGSAFALLGSLEAEVERASAAQESVSLRDFFVQHRTAIGRLQQKVLSTRDDFLAGVRITEETANRTGDFDAYGLQRLHLVEALERLDFRLLLSSPEDLFKKLSEEWIRQQTVPGALGTSTPALIVIHINHDFTIRKAEIKGSGGQKIAEQLLIDSPDGVDVFGMKVPRRILYYRAGKSMHHAIVRLDENNRNVNEGSYSEGNYTRIEAVLKSSGLPPTKKLSGD